MIKTTAQKNTNKKQKKTIKTNTTPKSQLYYFLSNSGVVLIGIEILEQRIRFFFLNKGREGYCIQGSNTCIFICILRDRIHTCKSI